MVNSNGRNTTQVSNILAEIDAGPVVLIVLDHKYRFQYQSPGVEQLLGYDPTALVGEAVTDYLHPADKERFLDWLETLRIEGLDDEVTVKHRYRTASETWQWVRSIGETTTDGYILTTQPRAGQEPIDEQFRAFLKRSADTIAIVDDDATIRYITPSVQEICGYDPAELTKTTMTANVHPDDRADVMDAFQRVVDGELETITVEHRYQRADNAWIWVESRARRLEADLPIASAVLVSSREITQRKQDEQRLQQQNERLDKVASIISHDLRSPLTVASGRIELFEQTDNTDHLEAAKTAIERADQIIGDVMTLARGSVDPTAIEPVELETATRDAWAVVETRDATLQIQDSEPITADKSQLRRLLENLFRNAVEHAGPEPTVTVGTIEEGFYVADDGPGIDIDDPDRVFEWGFTADGDGTGFGLSIVEQIATDHNWEATVADSETGGTRFEFTGTESNGDTSLTTGDSN